MSSISFEVLGVEEARQFFEHASLELRQTVHTKLEQVCAEIAEYARSIAPVKSGEYRDSIGYRSEGEMRFTIFAGAKHAAVVEFGSAPHFILPRTARVLRFEVDGEIVFAKYVMHPGTAPQFIIHRAKKENMEKIVQAVRDGVREALRGGK
jgi:HK97 gp10 family phage protein